MGVQLITAAVTDDYRVELGAATCVRQDQRTSAFGRQPTVAPFHKRKYNGKDVHSLRREQIFTALGICLIDAPLQHAGVDQQVQAVSQDVGGNMPTSANFLVASIAEKERGEDKLRPTIAEDIDRLPEQRVDDGSLAERNVGAATAFRWRQSIHPGARTVFVANIARNYWRSAMRAYDGRRHGVAAGRVDQRRLQRMFARPQSVEAPEHQRCWKEFSPHIRQAVNKTIAISSGQFFEAAVTDEPVETAGENITRDANALMPLVEATHTSKGSADNQQRPAVADVDQRTCYRIGRDHSRRAF